MRHKQPLTFLILIVITSSLLIQGCNSKQQEQTDTIDKKIFLPNKNEVNATLLNLGTFKKEIISNGKLNALKKSGLIFNVSGSMEKIFVNNGSRVKKGELLSKLDDKIFQKSFTKAQINLKKAELELQDKLAGRGYISLTLDSIPEKEYEILSIRSGYKDAILEVDKAQEDLENSKLIAPFSGKIANLEVKEHHHISAGKEVMTLIDDNRFEVEFNITESELGEISLNNQIQVTPLALNKTYIGYVTAINPKVERNGTILVKALVENDGNLLEGMNVKVYIQKNVPEQFVVPKTAVVLRQNQEVLFKINNGRVYWTYVQVTNENSKQYSVIPHPDKSTARLSVGDTIVISDNLNLAHDSEVVIRNLTTE